MKSKKQHLKTKFQIPRDNQKRWVLTRSSRAGETVIQLFRFDGNNPLKLSVKCNFKRFFFHNVFDFDDCDYPMSRRMKNFYCDDFIVIEERFPTLDRKLNRSRTLRSKLCRPQSQCVVVGSDVLLPRRGTRSVLDVTPYPGVWIQRFTGVQAIHLGEA